ncbi:hypothetical protein HWV62_35578 [Athelia sp. TMB]|nr:hypothetical protein HWV62_18560 [Athelia sp. TMB]KAF7981084.1 hypothetical protein HWV62_35578 [Athelia sp. TMB]
MLRSTLSTCSPCRITLFKTGIPINWFNETQHVARRFRSSVDTYQRGAPAPGPKRKWDSRGGGGDGKQWRRKKIPPTPLNEEVAAEAVPAALQRRVEAWAANPLAAQRLNRFGIPHNHVRVLMHSFAKAVDGGLLTSPEIAASYHLDRFTSLDTHADACLTNVFYSWASDLKHRSFLETLTSSSTIQSIVELREASDMSYPAESFPKARAVRRKFHMHVGPTNSGKTHNALRALAAAKSGVYAGPLRLLAHEVWERLNKGQIVPLDMEPEPDSQPALESNFDALVEQDPQRPTVRRQGNPKFVRECNLLTGEEEKLVSEEASLVSCTIEMLSFTRLFDVAVVDEIQMIADKDRGSAWTAAVLGLHAKEIHLCGEETAIPIIKALLKETGDELVVNRYERLTPLVVQDTSLEGDLSRVQKGDCIVTFSRTGIFALKRQVELQTGMRCAVAYGRLPPEIRSEQAALFNDPDSGYDVIIGSDAIGMGLNLKIKRIVFEAVRKFNGYEEVVLSTSQIKQIAGRAGRYGLHSEAGGFTTTLFPNDLPILRNALDQSIPALTDAYLFSSHELNEGIVRALPSTASMLTVYEVFTHVAKMRWPYQMQKLARADIVCNFIDTQLQLLPLADKVLIMKAPIPWQDQTSLKIITEFLQQYCKDLQVDLKKCLESGPLRHLEDVESSMNSGPPHSSQEALNVLEGMHKLLIFYMWMHMRSPVAWHHRDEAEDLKERTEKALDWLLQGLSWGKRKVSTPDMAWLREKQDGEKIAFFGRKEYLERKDARAGSYRVAGALRQER